MNDVLNIPLSKFTALMMLPKEKAQKLFNKEW